jgi:competence protein ComEA
MGLSPRDALAVAGASLSAVALGAAAWLAMGDTSPPAAAGFASLAPVGTDSPDPAPTAGTEILVDVQGAVASPGVVRLASGSRVADAIAAAGGYSPQADLLAAATAINLAAALSDGAQVFVPVIGQVGGPRPGPSTGGGGLVNLNTASPEALEALPGIGPVTVQKIVAARQERPFTTLEELVEREVMNRGQLEDIRELVTL